ncbi:MAG: aldose epimerase [Chthoniobacteraceae bacterium]|nr:aldose epimerase [Chthoniobacteraceae bacterium]
MSAASHFSPGKAIRGGVPICFPWFGPRAGHPESPAHGFARTTAWEVESVECAADIVTLILRLNATDKTRALWPHDFVLRHRITIGATLEMTLETQNLSTTPFDIEEALHTYFVVSNARNVSISGLSNSAYVDKVDAGARKVQDSAPIRITGETDRVYPSSQSACVIEDPGLQRRITVEKSGSDTTVVWNPWIAKASSMADFGDDEWPGMLCVETANSGENAVTVSPGESHSMTASISVS